MVDDVCGDAVPDEVLSPTHSPVGRFLVGLSRVGAPMDKDNRASGPCLCLRDLVRDVHTFQGYVRRRRGLEAACEPPFLGAGCPYDLDNLPLSYESSKATA